MLLVGVAFLLASCSGGSADVRPRVLDPGPEEADTGDGIAERTVDVYSSVVRQLVTEDHTFGEGESPFDRVFVVDGVSDEAASSPGPVVPGSCSPSARSYELESSGSSPISRGWGSSPTPTRS